MLKKTPRSLWEDDPKMPLLKRSGRGRSLGSTWIWRAFAPEYRLRLASLVGNRNLYSARRLIQKIRHSIDGSLPLFTSDALRHYGEVLLEAFGVLETSPLTGKRGRPPKRKLVAPKTLRYAQIQKHRQGGRVVKVTRSVIFGEVKEAQINTAYIERDNLTLRQELKRLTRKTLGFSKNRRELQHALNFIDTHDNFVKPHQSLRIKAPPSDHRRWVPRTPAMAAGITDHIWTLEELLCYKR